jgi:hypothetical protein
MAPGRAHGTGSGRTPQSATAQAAQLALDHAARRAEIEVAPALDAPVVNLEVAAGLAALRAHAPSAAQAHRHHDAAFSERHIGDAGARQAQQALECGSDAHVVLLARPLISTTNSLL